MKGEWPVIRSTIAVFSQDRFVWTDKVGSFRRYRPWSRKKSPGGAVCDEWDMVKHGDTVLKHLCETGAVACDASALAAAARAGSGSVVRYLVGERGVDPAALDNFAIRWAALNGHTDVVKLLLDLPLERGVDPAADDNFAFRWAAENGHTAIVQLLLDLPLERGVDPAARNNSALCYAAENGQTDVVQLLLDLRPERGVDLAAKDNYAFRYAARNGRTDVVQLLLDLPLERGVDPAAKDNYAFRYAAKNGHADIVHLLLNLSPDQRPSRAVVQKVLATSLPSTVSVLLTEHLAETEPAPKRR